MNNKKLIAIELKNISREEAVNDFIKLKEIAEHKLNLNSNIGNKFVDYYTFVYRLDTTTKGGKNFYDFLQDIHIYKNKNYFKKFFKYYENRNISELNILYNFYRLYFGSVQIFKPIQTIELLKMFKPKVLLDFTMGWGGRLVGACALDIDKYIGIDLNKQLRTPYKMMAKELNKMSHTSIELYFENAVNFDYSKLDYDMVFTSPPYYNIEIYKGTKKRSIDEWNNDFYIPLFSNTFKYLKHKGIYALNINKEIYENVCIPILGKSYKKIPLQLSKRGNDYKEFIYIWKK